jgi:hypothetical protein
LIGYGPKERKAMTAKQAIVQILETLPDERVAEVLNFAQSLSEAQEREAWQAFGRRQFVKAYGADEPEYTEADIKPELNS